MTDIFVRIPKEDAEHFLSAYDEMFGEDRYFDPRPEQERFAKALRQSLTPDRGIPDPVLFVLREYAKGKYDGGVCAGHALRSLGEETQPSIAARPEVGAEEQIAPDDRPHDQG